MSGADTRVTTESPEWTEFRNLEGVPIADPSSTALCEDCERQLTHGSQVYLLAVARSGGVNLDASWSIDTVHCGFCGPTTRDPDALEAVAWATVVEAPTHSHPATEVVIGAREAKGVDHTEPLPY